MTTELPEKPESRGESYLAKIAGQDVTVPAPASRTEQYLAYIAENGGGGGGGTTYTAGAGIDITDNEISVDTTTIQAKLTAGTNITIEGNVISASGGGGAAGQPKVLTSDDNNWNSTNNSTTPPLNCVALWLLPSGYYTTTGGNATVRPYRTTYNNSHTASYLITNNSTVAEIVEFNSTSSLDGTPIRVYRTTVSNGNPAETNPYTEVLTKLMVKDSHGGDTNLPISQAAATHMGNILSTSAPTTSTFGVLGQLMTDTTNMHTYQLTAISGSTYTWTQRW